MDANRLAQVIAPPIEEGMPQNRLASQYGVKPPVMRGSYMTQLEPLQELAFQSWLKQNNVPFDDSPQGDYDMRAFFLANRQGSKNAQTELNANDGMLHYPDTYKTPYHQSFSNGSRYAAPGAPTWNEQDQLFLPSGKILFDERNR